MEHYDHLVIKGLINRGGSSSETYTYKLLTGSVTEQGSSVSQMWNYLDNPLKERLIEIFDEICMVNLKGKSDSQIVQQLIDYMANMSGRNEFHSSYDRRTIDRMSDDEL
ncbi:hypothetical protein [Vibrio gangliei]|uniref:hypothetical protein n=1 Tax=Vibrio gangliei TaxID=2077090 RepID=UPI000D01D8F2|nr:hypothetical protein [Vibrio gangliei]